ncbi:MAG: hypothetical protein AAGB24_09435 [Bacteroidota bacterium]
MEPDKGNKVLNDGLDKGPKPDITTYQPVKDDTGTNPPGEGSGVNEDDVKK